MESSFCVAALDWALRTARPEIFNTDQGSQFTCREFTGRLLAQGIAISMDGRGRALDNVFIERLWRSLKYELIYPGDFASGAACSRRWIATSIFTIISARTRRSATARRQSCFRAGQ